MRITRSQMSGSMLPCEHVLRHHQGDAGVVVEHVDASKGGDGLVDQRFRLGGRSNVRANEAALTPLGADGRDRLLAPDGIEVRDDDASALTGQLEGPGAAEAGPRSGDDGNAV